MKRKNLLWSVLTTESSIRGSRRLNSSPTPPPPPLPTGVNMEEFSFPIEPVHTNTPGENKVQSGLPITVDNLFCHFYPCEKNPLEWDIQFSIYHLGKGKRKKCQNRLFKDQHWLIFVFCCCYLPVWTTVSHLYSSFFLWIWNETGKKKSAKVTVFSKKICDTLEAYWLPAVRLWVWCARDWRFSSDVSRRGRDHRGNADTFMARYV